MFDRNPASTPHRDLWQAVLQRQIHDALFGPEVFQGSKEKRRAIIAEAREYLTTPSDGLGAVCSLASLDPEAVLDRMRQRIAKALSPHELVAQGILASRPAKPKQEPKAKRKPLKHVPLTVDGITRTAAEWAALAGISVYALHSRLRIGWPLAEALTLTSEVASVKLV